MQKHAPLLLLIAAVVIVGALGYAITGKAPTTTDDTPVDVAVACLQSGGTFHEDACQCPDGYEYEALHCVDAFGAPGGELGEAVRAELESLLEAAAAEDAAAEPATDSTEPAAPAETSTTDGSSAPAAPAPARNVVTIEVSGMDFAFDKEEIRVHEGDVVRIVFTSARGFHDWVIDEFDARTNQVWPGETSEVTFVADRKGSFEYYCSVGAHRANGMVGTLIVE